MLAKNLQNRKINKDWYNVSIMFKELPNVDSEKPVAYDNDGHPLYLHPSNGSESHPQFVHMTRSTDPAKMVVSPETKLRHDRAVKAYPSLNLSEGEYIISDVGRHPAGLFGSLSIGLFLITLSLIALFNYDAIIKAVRLDRYITDTSAVVMPILIFIVLVALGMYVAYIVYINNRLYLTNESVIQEIQTGLFFKSEQTVSLLNIEDASYTQNGLFQQLFDYGSVRLSTEGDETTYRFTYVANPKQHIAKLNNAVEAFKNGRPVDEY